MFVSDLGGASLPTRGLFCSGSLHVLVVLAVFVVPWSHWMPHSAHLSKDKSLVQQRQILLLPRLEPKGVDGPAASSNKGGEEEALRSSPEAQAIKGVVYNGPQLMVTNPVNPDNFVQTIRQPAMAANPRLPTPLALPPMVTVAPVEPALEVQHEALPAQVAATRPVSLPPQTPKIEAPKLPAPMANPVDSLFGASASVAAPPPPIPSRVTPTPQVSKETKNLVVLDAIPSQVMKPSEVPPGELYGAFTISPEGKTAAGLAGGGVQSKGAPGIGNSGTAAVQYAEDGGKPSIGTKDGQPSRAGAGPGTEPGHGGAAKVKETGDGSGAGSRANANGHGTSGNGAGSSPFPAIMIQRGSGLGDGISITTSATSGDTQARGNYGMTIVSSGASGGGFKDFGVFRNEASYTVYLDMADAGARGSSWPMQYAIDRDRDMPPSMSAPGVHSELVPPYATAKSLPHFPAQTTRRGQGGTIVVFGVITPRGSFEDLRIMQSSNDRLNKPLLDSLVTWAFKPAEMNGAKVAVKVLLGVSVDSLPN
jgi:TonB family protein